MSFIFPNIQGDHSMFQAIGGSQRTPTIVRNCAHKHSGSLYYQVHRMKKVIELGGEDSHLQAPLSDPPQIKSIFLRQFRSLLDKELLWHLLTIQTTVYCPSDVRVQPDVKFYKLYAFPRPVVWSRGQAFTSLNCPRIPNFKECLGSNGLLK